MPRRDTRVRVAVVNLRVRGVLSQAEHPRGAEPAFPALQHEEVLKRAHGLEGPALRPLERAPVAAADAVASFAAAARRARYGLPVILRRQS